MAMSAFKSTTKRTPIGSQENNSASSATGVSDSSKPGGRRRSRSLSRFPKHYAELTTSSVLRQIDVHNNNEEKRPPSRNVSPVRDFKPGRFVNTVRGSWTPEDLSSSHGTACSQPDRGFCGSRRGQAVSRSQTDSSNESQSEAEIAQRRGRSVSRNPPKQSVPQADNECRRRSVSVAPYHFSDSESDIDPIYGQTGQQKPNNIGRVGGQEYASEKVPAGDLPKCQRGLRRCSSQRDLSRSYDSYSSYASTLTDDEGLDMCFNDHVEEKTIRAVHAQSFRSDHPTGDMDAVHLWEAMRSEVRHAVAEIRFEVEQATAKHKSSAIATNGSNVLSESKATDVIQAVANIRKGYVAKLEQSEKRASDLWAKLAVEEQRCHELAKIVEELLPEPKSSQTQRPSRTRKRSADRKRMSKCLNEEAQKYFEEFIVSKIEDSEISSLEEEQNDAPFHDIKTKTNGICEESLSEISNIDSVNCPHNNIKHSSLPPEADGVLLPWLQWETESDNTPQFNRTNTNMVMAAKKLQQDIAEDMGSSGSNSSCGSGNIDATSSNGSNSSLSPDNSSPHYNMSTVDPSAVESISLSSTRDSGESRDGYNIKHKVHNIAITKGKGCVRSPTTRSSYQDDEYILYANNEAILNERMKLKSRIASGGLMLCGSGLL